MQKKSRRPWWCYVERSIRRPRADPPALAPYRRAVKPGSSVPTIGFWPAALITQRPPSCYTDHLGCVCIPIFHAPSYSPRPR